jgi:itaconyl-CoA hydratase
MSHPSDLRGKDNYFEDFVVGAVVRHARGKTIETAEHVMVTQPGHEFDSGTFQ